MRGVLPGGEPARVFSGQRAPGTREFRPVRFGSPNRPNLKKNREKRFRLVLLRLDDFHRGKIRGISVGISGEDLHTLHGRVCAYVEVW